PLRGGQSPLARPIATASPARRLSRFLRRSRALRVGYRGGRNLAIGGVRGAGGRDRWLRRHESDAAQRKRANDRAFIRRAPALELSHLAHPALRVAAIR